MIYIVDRIENGVAVLVDDNGETLEISAKLLPEGAKESDALTKEKEGFVLCENERKIREEKAKKLLEKLFKK